MTTVKEEPSEEFRIARDDANEAYPQPRGGLHSSGRFHKHIPKIASKDDVKK